MRTDFARVMGIILRLEGGYTPGVGDPGGETKYGISKRAYPTEDIAALTPARAQTLYAHDYWGPLGCDAIEWPLCLIHMDAGVNHGVSRAKRFLAQTQDAAVYLRLRSQFYDALIAKRPALAKYRRGWRRRLEVLRRAAYPTPGAGP